MELILALTSQSCCEDWQRPQVWSSQHTDRHTHVHVNYYHDDKTKCFGGFSTEGMCSWGTGVTDLGLLLKAYLNNHKKTKTVWSYLFYLYEESKEVKFVEAESRMEVARDRGRRNGELLSMNTVSDLPDEKDGEIGCKTVWMYLTLLNGILKKWVRW